MQKHTSYILLAVLLILVSVLCGSCVSQVQYSNRNWEIDPSHARTVHITGTIDSDDLKRVAIQKVGDDIRFDPYFKIKVKNDQLSSDVILDRNNVYVLMIPYFNSFSQYHVVPIFPDQDTVSVEIKFRHSKDDYFKVVGSRSNQLLDEYQSVKQELFGGEGKCLNDWQDSLVHSGNLYSKQYEDMIDLLYDKRSSRELRDSVNNELMKIIANREDHTPAGNALSDAWDQYFIRVSAFAQKYISSSEVSIPLFYLLVDLLQSDNQRGIGVKDWIELYDSLYADKFPECNLHDVYSRIKQGLSLYEGASFKDFSLPDTEGNIQSLSGLIEGKVAVLDLWASWCGSCRREGMSLMPLYEKYKDSGFIIVGVAREYKTDAAWRHAVRQDGYTWPNLLAMEDSHYIWSEYGIFNGGGKVFLIGKDGTILKIGPTIEEIEDAILASL